MTQRSGPAPLARLTVRSGLAPLVEVDSAGRQEIAVYGPGGLVALLVDGQALAVSRDGRGSTRVVWDAGWFLYIAEHGYGATEQAPAFYPLYPYLLRIGAALLDGHSALAGFVLSLPLTLCAFVLLYALASRHVDQVAASRSVAYLALFPYAFFLQAFYSETAFLIVAMGACLAAERQRLLERWCLDWRCDAHTPLGPGRSRCSHRPRTAVACATRRARSADVRRSCSFSSRSSSPTTAVARSRSCMQRTTGVPSRHSLPSTGSLAARSKLGSACKHSHRSRPGTGRSRLSPSGRSSHSSSSPPSRWLPGVGSVLHTGSTACFR